MKHTTYKIFLVFLFLTLFLPVFKEPVEEIKALSNNSNTIDSKQGIKILTKIELPKINVMQNELTKSELLNLHCENSFSNGLFLAQNQPSINLHQPVECFGELNTTSKIVNYFLEIKPLNRIGQKVVLIPNSKISVEFINNFYPEFIYKFANLPYLINLKIRLDVISYIVFCYFILGLLMQVFSQKKTMCLRC